MMKKLYWYSLDSREQFESIQIDGSKLMTIADKNFILKENLSFKYFSFTQDFYFKNFRNMNSNMFSKYSKYYYSFTGPDSSEQLHISPNFIIKNPQIQCLERLYLIYQNSEFINTLLNKNLQHSFFYSTPRKLINVSNFICFSSNIFIILNIINKLHGSISKLLIFVEYLYEIRNQLQNRFEHIQQFNPFKLSDKKDVVTTLFSLFSKYEIILNILLVQKGRIIIQFIYNLFDLEVQIQIFFNLLDYILNPVSLILISNNDIEDEILEFLSFLVPNHHICIYYLLEFLGNHYNKDKLLNIFNIFYYRHLLV